MTRYIKHLEAIPAIGALNAITAGLRVADYDDVSFALAGDTTAVFTVTVFGSISKACPDFTAAKSATNVYDAIVCQDYEDDAAKAGDTGIPFTENDVMQFSASVSGLSWIAFKVTAYTSGQVTPSLTGYNNA